MPTTPAGRWVARNRRLKFASWLVEDVPMNLILDLRLGTTAGAALRTSVVESRVVVLHGRRTLELEPSTC